MTNKYHEECQDLAKLLGIKIAPYEQVVSYYPDEYRGMKFYEEKRNGAPKARKKYSKKTQEKLIKAFNSHNWKITSDIYGHDGLSRGGICKDCKRKFKVPIGKWSDDFILAYHLIYGRHKRFGGRITKCKK